MSDSSQDNQSVRADMIGAPRKVVVVYVYPTMGGDHDTYARRFADSYRRFRSAVPHQLVVVSNGGRPTGQMQKVFKGLEPSWLIHDDSGWDIGAYRKAAREIPCDLMVFFGGSSHLRGARWLDRIVESFQQHGEAIYGAMGSLGHNIHIRTTAFWLPPSLLNQYPYKTTNDRVSRYDFEHGKHGLTMWTLSRGLKAWMVTWKGCYQPCQWDDIPNGFHQGDQSALIAWDRLADPPYHVPRVTQVHAPPPQLGAPIMSARTLEEDDEPVRVSSSSSLTVVYVVRASNNTEPSHKFFTAYRKNPSGVPHDLVVAAVGFENEAATLLVKKSVWNNISPEPRVVLVSDPGFTLGVFRDACEQISAEYVCLLDENSRPLVSGWLNRLYTAISKSGVGIAGASGAHQIDPHVRNNAFCIRRTLYLEITKGASKKDAASLQADRVRSITRAVKKRGLSARIVGRTKDHDLREARDSHTFWWGEQNELLVADDQTDDYTNGSPEHRAFLRSAGWPSRR